MSIRGRLCKTFKMTFLPSSNNLSCTINLLIYVSGVINITFQSTINIDYVLCKTPHLKKFKVVFHSLTSHP